MLNYNWINKNSDLPIVVLIHGYLVDSSYWNSFYLNLIEKYQIITIDLLGFGDSDKNRKYHYDLNDQTIALEQTIRKLISPNTKITLIGHSLGSVVCLSFAIRNPETIKQLILSNMPVIKTKNDMVKIIKKHFSFKERLLLLSPLSFILWNKYQIHLSNQNDLPIKRHNLNYLTKKSSYFSRRRTLKNLLYKLNTLDMLKRVNVKTSLIIGLNDDYIYQTNLENFNRPKQLTIIYVKTGHQTPITSPTTILNLLEKNN